jgi:hypothetical protein
MLMAEGTNGICTVSARAELTESSFIAVRGGTVSALGRDKS